MSPVGHVFAVEKGGHQAADCWCKDLECHSCGKKGHIEWACQGKKKSRGLSKNEAIQRKYTNKKKGQVHAVEEESRGSSDSSDEVPCHVLSVTGASHGYWASPLLDGKSVRMEIDTGAAVSLRNGVQRDIEPPTASTSQAAFENVHEGKSRDEGSCGG